jgi:hypothetical protein
MSIEAIASPKVTTMSIAVRSSVSPIGSRTAALTAAIFSITHFVFFGPGESRFQRIAVP